MRFTWPELILMSSATATTRWSCRLKFLSETIGPKTSTPVNGVWSRVEIIWCISTWTQWAINVHGCGLYRCVHCAACTSNVCTYVQRFKESYGDFPRFAEGLGAALCVCVCVSYYPIFHSAVQTCLVKRGRPPQHQIVALSFVAIWSFFHVSLLKFEHLPLLWSLHSPGFKPVLCLQDIHSEQEGNLRFGKIRECICRTVYSLCRCLCLSFLDLLLSQTLRLC